MGFFMDVASKGKRIVRPVEEHFSELPGSWSPVPWRSRFNQGKGVQAAVLWSIAGVKRSPREG